MKNPSDFNIYFKNIESLHNENMHCESTDDISSCSSIQETTLSMRTDNFQKPKEIECETDINDQNILNKQNEKLRKPCKNGNCYCFTSDSDDFRIVKNRNLSRSKQSKSKKDTEVNHHSESCSRESDLESFTSLDSSKELKRTVLPSILKSNSCRKEKCNFFPNHNLTSKTVFYGKPNKQTPIIHIIQEFHNNSIISEVRINRNQKQFQNDETGTCKKKVTDIKKKIHLENNSHLNKFQNGKDSLEHNLCHKEDFIEENLVPKNKTNFGGQLYQKRIGSESFRHYKEYKSPPKKPPRSVSSCSEKSKMEIDINIKNRTHLKKNIQNVVDNCSTPNIAENKSHKNIRKSFPLDNKCKIRDLHYDRIAKNTNFNCSFTENEKLNNEGINFGWVRPDTEIVEMLESNGKLGQQSLQQKPEAQMGCRVPPKLDIDTVDGLSQTLPNDSHNFAHNMESKSTPIKSDFTNETSSSVKKQFKDLIYSSTKKDRKNAENQNKHQLNSSFREKAKIGAKVFLINSKQKLVEMVSRRGDKQSFPDPTTKKNVAVQTVPDNFFDNINNNSFYNSEEINRKTPRRYNLQSPYLSFSTTKNSANDFDFNRTINSPKAERSTHRKLSFSPKKLIKTFNYRPVCINPRTSDNNYYKSFDNHINKDFTLSSINDILLNIRSKLETSDNFAENTFRELDQRDSNLKRSLDVKEDIKKDDALKNICNISAQAEIHNSPQQIYSEYEEEKLMIAESPSNDSVNEISHYFINDNPNAIYAKVNKVTRSNINVRDILPNINKLDLSRESQIYLDNLEKNENDQKEWENSQIINKRSVGDVRMDSLVSFEEGKEVEYESVNDISYDIHNMTPNNASQIESKDESSLLMDTDVVDGFLNSQIDVNCKLEFPHQKDLKLHHKNKIIIPKVDHKSNKSSPVIYNNIKKKFRESFNKGKTLLKKETNLFSSLTKSKDLRKEKNPYGDTNKSTIWDESDLGIYELYSEVPSISEQLQKTVSLCRKIPYFDSTLEAVEAERLLLYSTLKTEKVKNIECIPPDNTVMNGGKILIESFKLEISTDINRDIFFNYFYIAVFSYGSVIKSSNFAEKLENSILFRNCNIIFNSVNRNSEIKCDIYMLRLRKVLNNGNSSKIQEQRISQMENLDESHESSGEELLSRFKLQACFKFYPKIFIPYTIEKQCKNAIFDNIMCLHSKNSTTIPLIILARGTYLKNEVIIHAALEILFQKFEIEEFISLQDINNKHNWNRFWCKLDDFVLKIWTYPQDCLEKEVIYSFDLSKCLTYPVKTVDRSLCARLRTFLLTFPNEGDNISFKNVFFSADNQDHLNFWIEGLNRILEFVNFWMKIKRENDDF